MSMFYVTGKTFPHKSTLRAAGGRWFPEVQGWGFEGEVPQSVANLPGCAYSRTTPARVAVRTTRAPSRRDEWRPCGYPGCSPAHCDECG